MSVSEKTLPPLPCREECARKLRQRRGDFSTCTTLHVGVMTYNVAETEPQPGVCRRLLQADVPYDIIAVTLQEVDMSPWALALVTGTEAGIAWADFISEEVNALGSFVKIVDQQLVGTMLLLYVRQPLYSEVRDLATQYFRSGTFWVATTKGGIVARFTLHGRRFVFCGMHLSPHPENVEVRHQEYEQSLATLQELVELGQRGDELDLYLPPGHWLWGLVDRDPEDPDAGDELPAPTDTLQTHSGLGDYFLFAGDLNYRVDLPYADAVESVRAGDLAPLLAKDQLKAGQEFGRCFVGFSEGPLAFNPSYKFDPDSTVYDTSAKRRTPSWTDRVLWACEGASAEDVHANWAVQRWYGSLEGLPGPDADGPPQALRSDHRPVGARFEVRGQCADLDRLEAVIEEVVPEAPLPLRRALKEKALGDGAAVRDAPLDVLECGNCAIA